MSSVAAWNCRIADREARLSRADLGISACMLQWLPLHDAHVSDSISPSHPLQVQGERVVSGMGLPAAKRSVQARMASTVSSPRQLAR